MTQWYCTVVFVACCRERFSLPVTLVDRATTQTPLTPRSPFWIFSFSFYGLQATLLDMKTVPRFPSTSHVAFEPLPAQACAIDTKLPRLDERKNRALVSFFVLVSLGFLLSRNAYG